MTDPKLREWPAKFGAMTQLISGLEAAGAEVGTLHTMTSLTPPPGAYDKLQFALANQITTVHYAVITAFGDQTLETPVLLIITKSHLSVDGDKMESWNAQGHTTRTQLRVRSIVERQLGQAVRVVDLIDTSEWEVGAFDRPRMEADIVQEETPKHELIVIVVDPEETPPASNLPVNHRQQQLGLSANARYQEGLIRGMFAANAITDSFPYGVDDVTQALGIILHMLATGSANIDEA